MEAVKSPAARERDKARKRERYHSDPEYRERSLTRAKAANKARRQDNPEWLEKERARNREYMRQRRLRDPEYVERQRLRQKAYYARTREAKRRSPEGPFYTTAQVLAAVEFGDRSPVLKPWQKKLIHDMRAGWVERVTVHQADLLLEACGSGTYYIEEDPHE